MRSVIRILGVGLCAATITMCSAGAQAPDGEAVPGKPGDGKRSESMAAGQKVDFEVLKTGSNAFGFDKPAERLIQDLESWTKVWNAVESGVIPRPPVQPVDFEKSSLVALFAGEKRTGGYSIAVEAVSLSSDGKTLTVRARETSPPKGSITTMVLTSPYQIVKVARGTYQLQVIREAK